MTIPKSWYDKPVSRLTDYACEVYNDRHPEIGSVFQLNSTEFFLAKDYRRLGTAEAIKDVIERGDTLDIVAGVPRPFRDRDLQLPRF